MSRQPQQHSKLSAERIAELSELARKIDLEEGSGIRARGKEFFARRRAIGELLAALKQERLRQGMTLSDAAEAAGLDKANLSRLENDPSANPTIETILRIAGALGRRVRWKLE